VNRLYLDGEVMIEAKPNQEWFLTRTTRASFPSSPPPA